MISELGKIYLKYVQEGKICNCMIASGKLCPSCIEKELEKQKVLDRNKKINKIFGN